MSPPKPELKSVPDTDPPDSSYTRPRRQHQKTIPGIGDEMPMTSGVEAMVFRLVEGQARLEQLMTDHLKNHGVVLDVAKLVLATVFGAAITWAVRKFG